jgi:tetratricopeptide (TPR) repeat protein
VGTRQVTNLPYALGRPEHSARNRYKHAIELDHNFARAYSLLAAVYNNSGQPGLATESAQKAFELRERVSEREKLHITDQYYSKVMGELNKSIEALELYKQTYPRDPDAHNNLGVRYNAMGQYEKAIEALREALRLNPNFGLSYRGLVFAFMRLNRFEEAKAIGEQSLTQKLEFVEIPRDLYNIAFIHEDTAAMKQQVDWANARPGEYAHLTWQAGAAAFAGQWQKARELSNRAAELAGQRNLQEVVGDIVSGNALRSAVLGHCQQSRADLARAAALPRTPNSLFTGGMSLALCGATAQAQALNDEAVKRYPKNTIVNEVNLPLIRAALELQRGNHTQAIQILSAASRYESVSYFYQNYLRGQAYLGERNGAAAASEFQKMLEHRGWSPTSPLYPLAHLGLARAAMLQGDTAKARKSYQDFFALWKDADAYLPVLIEAKKEYEKVK